jgi:hypothetical protein
MTTEAPIKITNREELTFLLSVAASLEHMIMCEYLFGAFSLMQGVDEGITEAQLEAIKRWERAVSQVAVQEMLHLALVCNLLSAIGAIPFFNRPNFPSPTRYYAPGVHMSLLPFGEDALQHFLYLERPEGMDLKDAPEFQALGLAQPEILLDDDQIVAEAEEFATVGHLYRGVEQGLRTLVDKYGEQRVFIGPAHAQATQQYFGWPELVPVTNLASAIQAIETIVEQGEGARGDWQHSHYGAFLRISQEYRTFKQQDPHFEPTRPSVAAFVRPPSDVDNYIHITDPFTASVAALFNACYEVVLQLLIRYFLQAKETPDELRTLSGTAVDGMFTLIKPLGTLLTTLPLGPEHPGKMAGASFEIYRTGYILPHHHAAWQVLHERLLELADFCAAKLADHPSASPATSSLLQEVAKNLRAFAARLAQHRA